MTVNIRIAEEMDAERILAIYAPVVRNTTISFEKEPPTAVEMRHRIAQTLEKLPWLVCEDDDDILGYAYASEYRGRAAYRWSVITSIYMHEKARRRGIGRALYGSLFNILILQGYYNVYVGISQPNLPSVALHESMGFKPVGIYHSVGYLKGAWHDVGWWHLTLQDYTVPPAAPLLLRQAQESAGWDEALSSGLSYVKE